MNQVASVTSAANWIAWKNSWAAVTRSEFSGGAPYWRAREVVVEGAVRRDLRAAGCRRRWCSSRSSPRPRSSRKTSRRSSGLSSSWGLASRRRRSARGPSAAPRVAHTCSRVRQVVSAHCVRGRGWRSARRSGRGRVDLQRRRPSWPGPWPRGSDRESSRSAARRSAPVRAGRARCRSRRAIVRSDVAGRPVRPRADGPCCIRSLGLVEHLPAPRLREYPLVLRRGRGRHVLRRPPHAAGAAATEQRSPGQQRSGHERGGALRQHMWQIGRYRRLDRFQAAMTVPLDHLRTAGRRRPAPTRLRRMQAVALGLLVFAAIVYVATLDQDGFLGFVNAGAEASMVGAIADWFAVTALFRHPLGLPIPHTALIPQRKDEFGKSLEEFFSENFLQRAGDPRAARRGRHRPPGRVVGERAGQRGPGGGRGRHRARASGCAGCATPTSPSLVEEVLIPRFMAEPISPVAGGLLQEIVADNAHHGLVDLALEEAHRWLVHNQETFADVVGERAPWWAPERVNDAGHHAAAPRGGPLGGRHPSRPAPPRSPGAGQPAAPAGRRPAQRPVDAGARGATQDRGCSSSRR